MAEASGVNGERLRKLHVRLFGENRAVDIEKGWSVLQLKEQLCKISGRKLDELHIIFAGHVLADDLTLEVCIDSCFLQFSFEPRYPHVYFMYTMSTRNFRMFLFH